MRPEILNPLFATVDVLPGVGPRIAKAIGRIAGERVVDLLWHLPSSIVDRRYSPSLAEARAGTVATLTVTIDQHDKPRTKRLPYRVHCSDETGTIVLVFFHPRADWLTKTLPIGERRVISGQLEQYGDALQMAHPDHIVPESEAASVLVAEPVYPLTAGLTPKPLRRAIDAAIERAPHLVEWQDAAWLRQNNWPTWNEALHRVHRPDTEGDLIPGTPWRDRLAYDELLANQLALSLVRAALKRGPGRSIKGTGDLRERVSEHLPFALTVGQRGAIAEIDADMEASGRMLRLLQGDVGSGKTIVALFAMLSAVERGAQTALMAPTEILARQHFATLSAMLAPAGITCALLTGRERGKSRAALLARLADGEIPVIVGTHALFQDDVEFQDLALVVVDEQHRFGVHQRLTLTDKGTGTDVLVMTATPIPRTLMLTAYGDMEVSRLMEKPPGRAPVETRVMPLERLQDVTSAVRRATDSGARVYWVCPLVEDSTLVDLAAAEDRHAGLKEIFGDRVGLIHGRMKAADKDAAMAAFAAGDIQVLVATTVIEVGVDVPDATVMIIEHADRFGLSQLHQLRGRVGRGGKPGTCLLLYKAPLTETARARLEILRETEDGFRIAEEDLRLRGAGELLGTRQSGLPEFRLADISLHGDLLQAARDDARLIIERDGDLQSERGQALRILLYLFERDSAIRYLRSG